MSMEIMATSFGNRKTLGGKMFFSSKDYGLGTSLNWAFKNIAVSYKYLHGLNNIGGADEYNRMMNLSLGYMFELNKS